MLRKNIYLFNFREFFIFWFSTKKKLTIYWFLVNLCRQTFKTKIQMLRHKSTVNLCELQKYFSSSEKAILVLCTKYAVETLFKGMRSLKNSNKPFRAVDKINAQHSGKQIFILLLLFPLFAIKDISCFTKSPLYQHYKCGKDVFFPLAGNLIFSVVMVLAVFNTLSHSDW